jgi:hypothetical protein
MAGVVALVFNWRNPFGRLVDPIITAKPSPANPW